MMPWISLGKLVIIWSWHVLHAIHLDSDAPTTVFGWAVCSFDPAEHGQLVARFHDPIGTPTDHTLDQTSCILCRANWWPAYHFSVIARCECMGQFSFSPEHSTGSYVPCTGCLGVLRQQRHWFVVTGWLCRIRQCLVSENSTHWVGRIR